MHSSCITTVLSTNTSPPSPRPQSASVFSGQECFLWHFVHSDALGLCFAPDVFWREMPPFSFLPHYLVICHQMLIFQPPKKMSKQRHIIHPQLCTGWQAPFHLALLVDCICSVCSVSVLYLKANQILFVWRVSQTIIAKHASQRKSWPKPTQEQG